MSQGNGSLPGGQPHVDRDDTTRYLCAAAHLDAGFADQAIREFLVEETRPALPAPGVDAAVVLGEAVAARVRRKARDIALAALMVAFACFASISLLIAWILVANASAVPRLLAGTRRRPWKQTAVRLLITATVLVVSAIYIYGAIFQLIEDLFTSSTSFDGTADSSTSGETTASIVLIGLMFAVLLIDRLVVWNHLTVQFCRHPTSRLTALNSERPTRSLSPPRFLRQLDRYVRPRPTMAQPAPHELPSPHPAPPPAPVIVYRGFNPFVGAGEPYAPWSIAVPLERLPDGEEPKGELSTISLYAGITQAIAGLRKASALAPHRRFGQLKIGEQIVVSAGELIDHLADPVSSDFLATTGVPPFTSLRGERVGAIKVDPPEWARYYLCFQVETWDRDLVFSVFLHVAVDQDTLYVEWTPCVLRPIKWEYQRIDVLSRSVAVPVGHSLVRLVKLPASILGRTRRVLTFIRPLSRARGVISPDMFGALHSLRELAEDDEVHNYFQFADWDRYLKVLESRLMPAISRLMRDAGYSPAAFDRQAAQVIDKSVHIGTVVGNNFFGGSNNRGGPVSVAAPVSASPTRTG